MPVLSQPVVAIVDDELSVRRAVGRLLRAAGMEARIFATGADFLEDFRTTCADCLVVDLHMPAMSGFDLMEKLAGRLPVVVITGMDSQAARMRSFAAGAGAYLHKPVNDETLLGAIREAIICRVPPGS